MAYNVANYRTARGPIGRVFKHTKGVPQHNRLLHLDSLATTHLHYGVETWPPVPTRQFQRLHGSRTPGYRMSLGLSNQRDIKTTDDQVLIQAQRAPLMVMHRGRRLKHLQRALAHRPEALLQMFDAEDATGWSHQLLDDFAWLAARATELAALQRLRTYDPDSRRHWTADRWAQLAREDCGSSGA